MRKPTIICAIRARHQLLIGLLEWEVCLQVKLLRCRKVQRPRNNRDDTVPKSEALIEGLAVGDHRVEHLPALRWVGDNELLDLLELMHAEDAPHIPPCGPGLFSETCRVSGVFHWQLGIWTLEPLIRVECRDGLFRGRD